MEPANPSASANASSYFENPSRDKDVDFTKVLDFDSAYDDIKKDANDNISDTQKNYQKQKRISLHKPKLH